jgi:hypothetical protein
MTMQAGSMARALVAALGIVVITGGGGGCKSDDGGPAGAPDAAVPAAPQPPEVARPAPAEDPSGALEALFDALRARDRAAIEATLVSADECLAMTNDAARCQGIAARRQAFLDLFERTPLPAEARLVNILLLKSVEVPADDQKLTRSVRIQPGSVKFSVGEDVTTLRNVAAIEVAGGWRVLPGKPQQPVLTPVPTGAPLPEGAAPAPGPEGAAPAPGPEGAAPLPGPPDPALPAPVTPPVP